MILSFKPQFVAPILAGTKIHSIRKDPHNRWVPGKHIHFATGVRTSNYECFHEAKCKWVQGIQIYPEFKQVRISQYYAQPLDLTNQQIDHLAKNDGFNTTEEFWQWFSEDFFGVIVHWTDLRY